MRSTAALLLLLHGLLALPVRKLEAHSGPVLVELPAATPSELLECLRRHRYTPHACRQLLAASSDAALSEAVIANATAAARRAPEPLADCGSHNFSWLAQCAGGRGHCAYDALRGWHCRCNAAMPELARGLHREAPKAERVAPDCIEEWS